jgi:hypothetical protein
VSALRYNIEQTVRQVDYQYPYSANSIYIQSTLVVTTGLVGQKNVVITSCRYTVYNDIWGVWRRCFFLSCFFTLEALILNPKLSCDIQINKLLMFSRMWCCVIPVCEHLNDNRVMLISQCCYHANYSMVAFSPATSTSSSESLCCISTSALV